MSEVAMSQVSLSDVSNPEYSSNCHHMVKDYNKSEGYRDLPVIPEIRILIANTDHK